MESCFPHCGNPSKPLHHLASPAPFPEGPFFNFSTFQLFNRAEGARAARFPLHHDAPSARRELATC
jgi:hypothetical protein